MISSKIKKVQDELTLQGLNFRCGYAGKCVLDLLQMARRDSEMIKLMEDNKTNRINNTSTLDNVKQLTAGRLYRSGEVVLGYQCREHVRAGMQEKESEVTKMMDKHAVSFQKSITNANIILDKYNKKTTKNLPCGGIWTCLRYAPPTKRY